MKRPFLTLIAATLACSDASGPGAAFAAFNDDFNDGAINTSHWRAGGDITEAAGVLQLRRESPDDYIETLGTYSGDWTIELEIRLNAIGWNDAFHGISIRDSAGNGVTFGFTMYGELYEGRHEVLGGGGGTQTGYTYGPDGSNGTGQWQRWTIQKVGGMVAFRVNGSPVTGLGAAPVPDRVRVSLPGYYQDGDGGAHVGVTSSDVQAFSIAAP